MSKVVLVLTASGTTGRATVEALHRRGARVRAAVREPARAAFPDGVEAVRWDLDDPATWAPALAGVHALYLCAPPFRPDEVEVLEAAILAARAAGVERIVKLSAMGVEADPTSTHRRVELAVEASGAAWIHLRPTFFFENFIEFYGGSIATERKIYLPAGAARTSFVGAADIGELAAVALLSSRSGEAWPITGEESLDHHEVAARIGEAIGESVVFVDIPPEAFEAALREHGAPELAVATMSALYGMVRAGWTGGVVDTVQRELGRAPLRLAAWAVASRAAWI